MRIFWHLRVAIFFIISYGFINVFNTLFLLLTKFLGFEYEKRYNICKFFSQLFIDSGKYIVGLDYKIIGQELMPDVPSVVLLNHQSFWDNVIVQIFIPKHTWVVKQELLSLPFFGLALDSLDPIAVNRSESVSIRSIIKEGIKKIKSGYWMIIFPEATRVPYGKNIEYKPSAVKLATSANVPIVLVAHNAGKYWPKGWWIKNPGTIEVKILQTITPEEIQSEDVRTITKNIETIINNAKNEL